MQTLTNLKGLHKIHFIGIGGAGMSPLAKMMLEHGYEVKTARSSRGLKSLVPR